MVERALLFCATRPIPWRQGRQHRNRVLCNIVVVERTYCHPEMERKQEAAESILSSLHSEDGFLFYLQTAVEK